jgi:hypothetical protein
VGPEEPKDWLGTAEEDLVGAAHLAHSVLLARRETEQLLAAAGLAVAAKHLVVRQAEEALLLVAMGIPENKVLAETATHMGAQEVMAASDQARAAAAAVVEVMTVPAAVVAVAVVETHFRQGKLELQGKAAQEPQGPQEAPGKPLVAQQTLPPTQAGRSQS